MKSTVIVLGGKSGVGKTTVRNDLAHILGAMSLGPDDFDGDWREVYQRLDGASGYPVIVECCRLPRGLRERLQGRVSIIIELVASRDTQRQRLEDQGLPPEIIVERLAEEGGLGYEEEARPTVTIDTTDTPPNKVVAQLEARLAPLA
jgi:broad-specificity NMP kinase